MVEKKTAELLDTIRNTPEFCRFQAAKRNVEADAAVRALLKEYHQLQIQTQAAMVADRPEKNEMMQKLQRMGELLQFQEVAAEYLMAEYYMQKMLDNILRSLIEGVQMNTDLFGI